jgi:hypothetical protein
MIRLNDLKLFRELFIIDSDGLTCIAQISRRPPTEPWRFLPATDHVVPYDIAELTATSTKFGGAAIDIIRLCTSIAVASSS